MNERPKICVADNDLAELEKLANLLCSAGFAVSTYQTAEELLRKLDYEEACCVVFDSNLQDIDVANVFQTLSTRNEYLPVIFVGSHPAVSAVVQAIKAGAIDFIEKPITPGQMMAAVNLGVRRHQELLAHAVDQQRRQKQYKLLTLREREIFTFVIRGMLNKQIAAELGIAEKTVKVHRGRVMKKLEVQSIADLVRLSGKLSLAQTDPTSASCGPALTEIPGLRLSPCLAQGADSEEFA